MKKNMTRVVYILNNTDGITELQVFADSIEHRNGWLLALWNGEVMGGVKDEYLKAFYLEPVV